MLAALAGERVLAADETPVSVLDRAAPPAPEEEADPDEGRPAAVGAPHRRDFARRRRRPPVGPAPPERILQHRG